MSCIPVHTYDKHRLQAIYFLSAIGAREKPNCSDFEKGILFITENIRKVFDIAAVIPGVGTITTALAGYVFDGIKNELKIDLKKLEQFISGVAPVWDSLVWGVRHHIIRHGFENISHDYDGWFNRLTNGKLNDREKNWIYFVRSMVEGGETGSYNHWHWNEKNISYSITEVHDPGRRYGESYHSDFLRHALSAFRIIKDADFTQYETKPDGTVDLDRIKKPVFKSGFGLIGAAALAWGAFRK